MCVTVDTVREPDEGPNLAEAIMARYSELGGVELDLPPRSATPRPAEFAEDNP
jgi:hypothetical protein